MSNMGTIVNSNTVRFERLLPGPVERVWAYLTTPEGIDAWLFAGATIDTHAKGQVELRFRTPDPAIKNLHVVRGIVKECEPPRIFEYSWFETMCDLTSSVRFELEARGDQVLLVVTHTDICPEYMPKVGAGWHGHLEVLAAVLKGEKPPDFLPLYEELFKKYTLAISAAVVLSVTVISPAIASSDDPAYKVMNDQRQELLSKYDRVWKESDHIKTEIDVLRRDTHADTGRAQDDLQHELDRKRDELRGIEYDIRDLDKAIL